MIELAEIIDFLREQPPFDELDTEQLEAIVRHIEVEYFPSGSELLRIGDANEELHMIRSGAVELRDSGGELVSRLGEGEFYGYVSLLSGRPVRYRVRAMEDTVVYHLGAAVFQQLRYRNQAIDRYFTEAYAERLQAVMQDRMAGDVAMRRLRELVRRDPVAVEVGASVAEAATIMARERVSAILACEGGELRGILTDRDLRNRVVAAKLDYATPVDRIMTAAPLTMDAGETLADALLTMMKANIHHLPVTDKRRPIGMVSLADLLRAEAEHPIYIIGDVLKQRDVESIAAVCGNLPSLFLRLLDADATADQVGKMVTAVTDAVTRRLLILGEEQLGPPPVPYAWLALGSQARQEQTIRTDQDNALLLADEFEPEQDAYFAELAAWVSDGLARCGYPYCPGEVMATNPKWRQPLKVWRQYFEKWITQPEPKALMYSNIFFDLRCASGSTALVDELKDSIARLARHNSIFLAMMARNAMQFQPPLGFFRTFVLEKGGEHKEALNLKLNGVIPIVELARIHSLAAGEMRVNTRQRLRAAARRGRLNPADARSLEDALELIDFTRLSHQGRQIRAGTAPDNFVRPATLSPLARQNLKAAFSVVRTSQQALLNSFGMA